MQPAAAAARGACSSRRCRSRLVIHRLSRRLGAPARRQPRRQAAALAVGASSTRCARMAFEPDKRSGDYLLWVDTAASLLRLLAGLAIAAAIGARARHRDRPDPLRPRARWRPFVAVVSLVPPLALLPILFIALRPRRDRQGHADRPRHRARSWSATSPFRVAELPEELLVKAQTLGGSTWQMVLRVVLPQVLPRLLSGLRLSLGPAWLFLIAAEAIASTEGLGYRIFLVRRYLAMDVILPYVAWITLLAFLMDRLLALASRAPVPLGRTPHEPRSVVNGVWKSLRRRAACSSGSTLDVAERQLRHHGRRQRLRQDHLPAHAAGRRGRRRAAGSRVDGAAACARARPRPRHRLPALFGVPAPDRAWATSCCGLEFERSARSRPAVSAPAQACRR